jgi:N-carbamoylputrescine amidase
MESPMNVTVCEFDNDPAALEAVWQALCEHIRTQKSELVLLPEMPFCRWTSTCLWRTTPSRPTLDM